MDESEVYSKVEQYASLFLTIDEICLLCALEPTQFRREVRNGKSKLAQAYLRGKLESMVQIRRMTVEFAKKGSPQAESLVREYIEKMESNE
jgi:hypothetical protein